METHDNIVATLQRIEYVFGLPYFLDSILDAGHKTTNWAYAYEQVAAWISDNSLTNMDPNEVKVMEKITDEKMFAIKDSINNIASEFQKNDRTASQSDVIYFVFCRFFGKIIEYVLYWLNQIDIKTILTDFPSQEINVLVKELLNQKPTYPQSLWIETEENIDKLAQRWTAQHFQEES